MYKIILFLWLVCIALWRIIGSMECYSVCAYSTSLIIGKSTRVTSPRIPTAPPSEQLSVIKDRTAIIAQLVNPMSTLSSEEFLVMVQHPDLKYTRTILGEILEKKLSTTVLAWRDVGTVLRMFWLVNIAHKEISEWDDDTFKFHIEIPRSILYQHDSISDTDKAVLGTFEDLKAIMENMCAYKRVLFTKPAPSGKNIIPTESSTHKPVIATQNANPTNIEAKLSTGESNSARGGSVDGQLGEQASG